MTKRRQFAPIFKNGCQYGSSTADTTALDTWQHKKGVCQLILPIWGISLSRALDMPAPWWLEYLYLD